MAIDVLGVGITSETVAMSSTETKKKKKRKQGIRFKCLVRNGARFGGFRIRRLPQRRGINSNIDSGSFKD